MLLEPRRGRAAAREISRKKSRAVLIFRCMQKGRESLEEEETAAPARVQNVHRPGRCILDWDDSLDRPRIPEACLRGHIATDIYNDVAYAHM